MLRAFAARSCAARGFSRPAAGLLRAPSLRLLSAEAQPRRGTYEAPTEEKQLAKLQPRIAELYRKGRYKEALKVGEECHALALAAFGKLHPAVASMCNNLALMHKSLGDTDAAAALYKEALDCYRVVVGEEHASTATAACNLALLIRDTDAARLQEAQALLEGALQTRRGLRPCRASASSRPCWGCCCHLPMKLVVGHLGQAEAVRQQPERVHWPCALSAAPWSHRSIFSTNVVPPDAR